MADPAGWVVTVQLTESFHSAVADLIAEAGLGHYAHLAGDGQTPTNGVVAGMVLAGGSEAEGIDLLANLGGPSVPRFVIGASPDHRIAATALHRGARDYFALPQDIDLLRRTLERIAQQVRGTREAERFAEGEQQASGFDAMIGDSPSLRQMIDQAKRVALHRDVTVLIGGETGTGKELLARAMHYGSARASAPFVEINCAAIPTNLIESELFGHERGSFTGAVTNKPGLFELAHGGTVFLDEIGHLSVEMQPKLLRALESREVRRVGGRQSRPFDVRVVSASHVDLALAVSRGEFRQDLYYRLNVVHLVLPPLRERGSDIELLARTFIHQIAGAYGIPMPELTSELRVALRSHSWPGNVRELRNAIERALVLSPPGTLVLSDLAAVQLPLSAGISSLPFPAPLHAIVRRATEAMLELTGGNKSEAARRLDISRPRLQRILEGVNDV